MRVGRFVRGLATAAARRGAEGGRARSAASNPQPDEKSGRILKAAMLEVYPELSGTRIDYCWGGRPAIPGYFGRPWFLPIIGAYYRIKDLVG